MCVGHVVHAVCPTCQTHDPKLLTSYTPCPTAPINTLPVETTALPMTQHAKVVEKRVTGEQNAKAVTTIEIYVFGLCTERVIRSSWYLCFHEALLCWDTTHKIPTVTYKLNML